MDGSLDPRHRVTLRRPIEPLGDWCVVGDGERGWLTTRIQADRLQQLTYDRLAINRKVYHVVLAPRVTPVQWRVPPTEAHQQQHPTMMIYIDI